MKAKLKDIFAVAANCGLFSGGGDDDGESFKSTMLGHLGFDGSLISFLETSALSVDLRGSDEAVCDFLLAEVMSRRLNQLHEKPSNTRNTRDEEDLVADFRAAQAAVVTRQGGFWESARSFAGNVGAKILVESRPEDWERLDKEIAKTDEEFQLRRRLLLTRFGATVKSFLWSEEAKGKETTIMRHMSEVVAEVPRPTGRATLLRILTATSKDSYVKKISSAPPASRLGNTNALTKYKVGRVPDRGGRPYDQPPPPPEMPSWSQRQSGPADQGRGGGRGGGGGGGGRGRGAGGGRSRVQGAGWDRKHH